MISISKSELNILISNYLQSEGYYHTHFTFQNEAVIEEVNVVSSLEEVVRKGVMYMYVERHAVNGKLVECGERYVISEEHVCSRSYKKTKDDVENNDKESQREDINDTSCINSRDYENVYYNKDDQSNGTNYKRSSNDSIETHRNIKEKTFNKQQNIYKHQKEDKNDQGSAHYNEDKYILEPDNKIVINKNIVETDKNKDHNTTNEYVRDNKICLYANENGKNNIIKEFCNVANINKEPKVVDEHIEEDKKNAMNHNEKRDMNISTVENAINEDVKYENKTTENNVNYKEDDNLQNKINPNENQDNLEKKNDIKTFTQCINNLSEVLNDNISDNKKEEIGEILKEKTITNLYTKEEKCNIVKQKDTIKNFDNLQDITKNEMKDEKHDFEDFCISKTPTNNTLSEDNNLYDLPTQNYIKNQNDVKIKSLKENKQYNEKDNKNKMINLNENFNSNDVNPNNNYDAINNEAWKKYNLGRLKNETLQKNRQNNNCLENSEINNLDNKKRNFDSLKQDAKLFKSSFVSRTDDNKIIAPYSIPEFDLRYKNTVRPVENKDFRRTSADDKDYRKITIDNTKSSYIYDKQTEKYENKNKYNKSYYNDNKSFNNNDTSYSNQSILTKPVNGFKYIISPLKEHTGDVSVCAWNGNVLATGSDDSTLRIFKEGKQIKVKRLNSEITSLAWSNLNELSAGNYQGEIFTFNEHKNTLVHKHHLGPVFAMKYYKDHLLSVSYDGKAGILNDKLKLIKVHSKSVLDCDWIDENHVLTCSSDYDIGLVNLINLEIEYLKGHSNEVNCVSHKNNIVASSSDDSKVILWNIVNRKNLILSGHTKSVYSHKWTNNALCSVSADGGVILWDLESGETKNKYEHEKSVYGVEYSKQNNIIMSGGADRNVVFYDERIGEIRRFHAKGSVYDIKLSGNESLLCVCMADSSPVVLDLRYC